MRQVYLLVILSDLYIECILSVHDHSEHMAHCWNTEVGIPVPHHLQLHIIGMGLLNKGQLKTGLVSVV